MLKVKILLTFQLFQKIFVEQPATQSSSNILELVNYQKFELYITETTSKKIISFLTSMVGHDKAIEKIKLILHGVHIHSVNEKIKEKLLSKCHSCQVIEDLALALELGLDVIVTKTVESFELVIIDNHKLFAGVDLWVWTPKQLLSLSKALGYESKLYVKNISSLKELESLYKLEQKTLGTEALDNNRLEYWWQKYEPGIKALFYENQIVGAISLWPISETSAQSLKNRVKNRVFEERELEPLSRQSCQEKPCRFWYIGAIYLDTRLQSKGLKGSFMRNLLFRAFIIWLGDESAFIDCSSEGVEILAIAVNKSVASRLRKWQFQIEPGETLHGHHLYKLGSISVSNWFESMSFPSS